jgi:hypothetical protein
MEVKMTSVSYTELVNPIIPQLSIPTFQGNESVLECAYAYAECGWWIVPIKKGTKNPGSILGKGWPQLSSNKKSQLDVWLKDHPDRGIALHTGRSDAYIADVDKPDDVPDFLKKVLKESGAPYQSTRANVEGRGHYVFSLPKGVKYTNSPGSLGSAWGEIRTGNSVIAVEPTIHEKFNEGARYKWLSGGEVPVLPVEIASRLPKSSNTVTTHEARVELNDSDLELYVTSMNQALAPGLLAIRIEQFLPQFRVGSRHSALSKFLLCGFLDAKSGLYEGLEMVSSALDLFLKFKPRDEWSTPNEFWDLVRWSAAASQNSSEEELGQIRETGLALVQPGVRAWLKAVSNV